jgi:aminopeptidase N
LSIPVPRLVAVVVLAASSLLVPRANPAASGESSGIPAQGSDLVAAANSALAARDSAALTALAETSQSLAWIGERGLTGKPAWKFAILRLPTGQDNPQFLAIFYAYHTVQSIGDHFHRVVQADSGWRIGAEIPETETLGYRVRDHRVTARIEPKTSRCSFTDDAMVERAASATANLCLLRLSSVLAVESVNLRAADGKLAPIPYSTAPGCIAIAAPSKSFTLALKYRGTYNQPGQDSYITTHEATLTSYWWPSISRQPATLSMSASVPKGWTAIGQGEPRGKTTTDSTTAFSFRNDIACCYFTLDAAPYAITTRKIAGKKVSVCLLKADDARAKRMLDNFARALPYYNKALGPFPYTHYEMVETAGPFGGALEAYSAATYGPGSFGAVAHELAHTWWGGLLPNTYLRTMWNESFADYSDELQSRMSGDGPKTPALRGQHHEPDYGRGLLRAYAVPAMHAYDTSSGAHGAVGYGKGAQVLAMLEDLLGTEKMLRCMRRFIADHPRGEEADWPGFEAAVAKETGQDYGWFFEQWLNRGGVPIVGIANMKQAAGELSFDVVQEGTPYRLRIPIAIQLANGQTLRRVVEAQSLTDAIRIPVAPAAASVTLDPDGTLLMAGRKTDDQSDPFAAKGL